MIAGHKNRFLVVGGHASVALIVRTLLFAGLAFAGSTTHAQQPNPPVLFGSTPDSPVSGKTLFKEAFEGMPIGDADAIAGIWSRHLTSNANGTGVFIANTNPVAPGYGKYMRTYAKKINDSVYRTEFNFTRKPPRNVALIPTDGQAYGENGDYRGVDWWYGFVWCLDKSTPGASRSHLVQLHVENTQDQGGVKLGHSPESSLVVNSTAVSYYQEHQHEPNTPSNLDMPVVTNPVGKCYDIIFRWKRDSRISTNGSTGIVQLWMNLHGVNDATPKISRLNKQLGHGWIGYDNGPGGGLTEGHVLIGGYHSSWRWSGTNGDEYEARYDNFTVMDSTGSYAAMFAALNTP